MNWSDATKYLPAKEGEYLCILDRDRLTRPVTRDPFYHICHFFPEVKDVMGHTRTAYFQHGSNFKEVTHWMPLPEMPEKSE